MDSTVRKPSKEHSLLGYYLVIIFIIVSLLCQLVGFVAPGWLIIEVKNGDRGEVAIWYWLTCEGDPQNCDTRATTLSGSNAVYGSPLRTYQILVTVGLAACIASAGTVIVRVRRPISSTRSKCFTTGVAAFLCLVSGTLCLGAAGDFAKLNVDQANLLEALFGYKLVKVPYALILTGIGGIIACFCFFALLLIACCHATRPDEEGKSDMGRTLSPPTPTKDNIFVDQRLGTHVPYSKDVTNIYYSPYIQGNYRPTYSLANTQRTTYSHTMNEPHLGSVNPVVGHQEEIVLHPVEYRAQKSASLPQRQVYSQKPSFKKQRTSSHVISTRQPFSL